MRFATWGGKRKGAGRRKVRPGAASHARREELDARHPVHTNLSVVGDIDSLRQPDVAACIEECLRAAERARIAEDRPFRVVHYAIQRHHLHFIVEAESKEALARGMQGLAIRLARGINRVLHRRGTVFADRYFERVLKTPKQVSHCVRYVLNNERRHLFQRGQRSAPGWIDPFSSGRYFDGWRDVEARPPPEEERPVAPAETWLLAEGWRRHGLVPVDAIPGLQRRPRRPSGAR
jgi:REP element-mobilizing transposase RayT